jgi:glucose-6-phosphate 1-epimerase
MQTIEQLKSQFAIANAVDIAEGPGGLVFVRLTGPRSEALVLLSGGQVLSWGHHGEKPVVWLSEKATFQPGKSARGGVPVCWPWFGAHAEDKSKPAHGFARNLPWQIAASAIDPDGAPQVKLRLEDSDATHALWPYKFALELTITAGDALQLEMSSTNRDDKPFTITEALHTYFAIGDIHQATVGGLDSARYWDKTQGFAQLTQDGAVSFSGETDRVYQSEAECTIEDPAWGRRIRIAKAGSRSTVVWNPWVEISTKMEGMGETAFEGMLCVESANAMEDSVVVAPGASHMLMARYSVEER